MAAFIWDSSFLTGVDDVDEQHLYLVGLINKFGEMLVNNDLSEEKVEAVFTELLEYTCYHFKEEEDIMRNERVDPRFIAQHIIVHQGFVSQLNSLHRVISVESISSLRALLDFLIRWLAYHILGIDQTLAEQIRAIRSGSTPEKAFEIASAKVHNSTEALLKALNKLFEEVSDSNIELFKLNKSLEKKVEKRTLELQEINRHLKELTITDLLTNLPNRRFAMSQLTELWNESEINDRSLSCLMIDADNFKQVNDHYGHGAGDKVLIELSQELKKSLRSDDIICRLGGDEFLVICNNTSYQEALNVAQSLCDAVLALEVTLEDGSWFGSVSIGVASKYDQIKNMEALIKIADQGVYLAKKAGKGCIKSTRFVENESANRF